jgi:hypothetical protein
VTVIVCNARRHGTGHAAQRHGCTCPDAVTSRRQQRGQHIPGQAPTGKLTPGRSATWIVDERLAVTRRMTAARYSASEIALRLGVSQRHVQRYRALIRAQAT